MLFYDPNTQEAEEKDCLGPHGKTVSHKTPSPKQIQSEISINNENGNLSLIGSLVAAGGLNLKYSENSHLLAEYGLQLSHPFTLEENVLKVTEPRKDSLLPSRSGAGEGDAEERGEPCVSEDAGAFLDLTVPVADSAGDINLHVHL